MADDLRKLRADTDEGGRRYLDRRLEAFSDAGHLPCEALQALGIESAAMDGDDLRQFARQGLSSVAECAFALDTVNEVIGKWEESSGPSRLVAAGGHELIATQRSEDKADLLGQRLAQKVAAGPDWHMLARMGQPLAHTGLLFDVAHLQLRLVHSGMRAAGTRATEAGLAEKRERIDALLAARREQMGETFAPAVRDAIRAAILTARGNTFLSQFSPADPACAAQVRATLRDWGVPVELLRPEIDAQLAQNIHPQTLERWAADAGLVDDEFADAAPVDARKALVDSLGNIQLSTRVRVLDADRFEVQSGFIPVDPAMIVSVNARAALGLLTGIEISCSADGYEIAFRKGKDYRAGADVSAELVELKALGIEIDALASVDGAGHTVSGMGLRFAYPEGKGAMQDVLEKLLERAAAHEPIRAADLAGAHGISLVKERKRICDAGLGAKAVFDPGSASWAWSSGENVSASLGVRAMVNGAAAQVRYVGESNTGTTTKSELEFSARLALTATAGLVVGRR